VSRLSRAGTGRGLRFVAVVCLLAWLSSLAASGAAAARTPPVRGLIACRSGPRCDYGAAFEHFPTWGNVAPQSVGDCTFAAAADWEQIVLGMQPSATVIRDEFIEAGGSRRGGLAQTALWRYWQQEGVAGAQLTAVDRYTLDRADVERAVRTYAAMIVELSFRSHEHLARYVVANGLHDAVVDGFTPAGPLLVSWGQTLQMTWAQWRRDAIGMWAVTVKLTATSSLRLHHRQSRGLPPGSG
jgi:hypothetical protein